MLQKGTAVTTKSPEGKPVSVSFSPQEEEARAVEYSRLVSRVVRRFYLQGGDQDDLYQEGMIGLLKAIRSYDPCLCDNFEAYASLCIRRRLLDLVRREARAFQREEDILRQLTPDPLLVGSQDPELQCLANETGAELQGALKGLLSPFELTVLTPYLTGYSTAEISRELGRPPKSVENAVLRIRRKVAGYLAQSHDDGRREPVRIKQSPHRGKER